MIKNIRLIRGIGQFPHVDAGRKIDLGQLTLCFGENGRGKTTLTALFRSLADDDGLPILERKRIDATDEPQVVLVTDDNATPIVFENASWNRTLPNVVVFDDTFVEANVYSGLTVSPKQRQNLHDLILGPKAVQLQESLDLQVDQIERHSREIRNHENAIRPFLPEGLTIDKFCSLRPDPNVDERMKRAEQTLSAAKEQDALRKTSSFNLMELPSYHGALLNVERVLLSTLETLEQAALTKIQQHLAELGSGGEAWIADGVEYVSNQAFYNNTCPFCGTKLDDNVLIKHYRSYFSDSYAALTKNIRDLRRDIEHTFGPKLRAAFEQELRVAVELQQFWARFCEIDPIVIDTDRIFTDCETARVAIAELLEAKQASPLERMEIPIHVHELEQVYEGHRQRVAEQKDRLKQANVEIEALKAKIGAASMDDLNHELNRLKAVKVRYRGEVDALCILYVKERESKRAVEKVKDEVRRQLDENREVVFPTYQNSVNDYLDRFGAEFRLSDLKPQNLRSGSTTTYGAQVRQTSVDVGTSRDQTRPSFGCVLSGGDRTTLAFAFFLASLHQLPAPADAVVIIDDPISSMDSGRTLATAQEIRKLVGKFGQVIVLSHDKRFLQSITRHSGVTSICALQVVRTGDGSTLAIWDLNEELLTENDRRSRELSTYLADGSGNIRQIARDIRPHLESYLRFASPSVMLPETKLGQFKATCEERVGTPDEILSGANLSELGAILEFANRHHHDSNQGASTETINEAELRNFVKRTLRFTVP